MTARKQARADWQPGIVGARLDVEQAKRGSGAPSEEYYAARGYGRMTLRLSADALALLDAESARSGYSRAELIEEMIRIELDPTHEGYTGPRKGERCMGFVNRAPCRNLATWSQTGLCESCQDHRDEQARDCDD